MLQTSPDRPAQPALRVSEAERERVVALLREQCVAGHVTMDELAARVRTVYAAQTRAELDATLRDLPVHAAPAPSRLAGPLRKATRWTVALLSSDSRKGVWRLHEETNSVAVMGSCVLDLRQATLEGPEICIHAFALMGSIEIIVPEGVEVDLSGFALMGSKETRVHDAAVPPGAPVISVQAFALMGSVYVKSKPAAPMGALL